MAENRGKQMLQGILDDDWVNQMIQYHDNMVMDGVLSYPLIPFVYGKRFRPEVRMTTGELTVVFETQNAQTGTIKLTTDQFDKFKAHIPELKSFAISIRDKIPLEITNPVSNDGWTADLLTIDENFVIKRSWNVQKGTGLIIITDDINRFSMSAGALLHFENFICGKLTNAVRMWQDMMAASVTLRESLLSTFKPEAYFMAPRPILQDPVELDAFTTEFFTSS
jgi:hypothetical protein